MRRATEGRYEYDYQAVIEGAFLRGGATLAAAMTGYTVVQHAAAQPLVKIQSAK